MHEGDGTSGLQHLHVGIDAWRGKEGRVMKGREEGLKERGKGREAKGTEEERKRESGREV